MKRYMLRTLYLAALLLAAGIIKAQESPKGTIQLGEVVGGELSFYSDKTCETVITGTVNGIVYIKAIPSTGYSVEGMIANDIIVEKAIETGAAQARRTTKSNIPLGEIIAVSATETIGIFSFMMPDDGADVKVSATIPFTNYTISYDLAGGALAEDKSNPTSYTIESEAITLNNPIKAGYTFAGWTGTGLSEATTTVTIAKGSTGDRNYTAEWIYGGVIGELGLKKDEPGIEKNGKAFYSLNDYIAETLQNTKGTGIAMTAQAAKQATLNSDGSITFSNGDYSSGDDNSNYVSMLVKDLKKNEIVNITFEGGFTLGAGHTLIVNGTLIGARTRNGDGEFELKSGVDYLIMADCDIELIINVGDGPATLYSIKVSEPNVLLGDANSDGVVNIADIVCILNYINGVIIDGFNEKAANVNNDDVIDNNDIIMLVKMLLKKDK